MPETKTGMIALVGRPNVGKSTLLNHLLGQKISITSRKPQTTRHQIIGIKTSGLNQFVFVDTPGIHKAHDNALNRYMNKAASSAINDVDVVVFIIERLQLTDEDERIINQLSHVEVPVVLLINKVDQLEDKRKLLPFIAELQAKRQWAGIVPTSALKGIGMDDLEEILAKHLPEGPWFYGEDEVTNRSERFLASEIIREKVMRQLGQEIPYQVAVEIEKFVVEGNLIRIHGLILVERDGQKAIIIGKKGARLKQIGTEARQSMEILFDSKVMLEIWVKVKSGWSDDDRALKSLGYSS